ncbi:MAG: PCRF domain-containing protein, partial [Bacteroidales bacterium]|nr:PCRF domain-containing protein [Bacteroidales bacterium]
MRSASRRSGGIFDIDRKLIQLEEEEEKTKDPKFWDDPKAAEKQLKQVASIKEWITAYNQVTSALDDLNVVLDFFKEGEAGEEDVDLQFQTTLKLT